MNVPRSSPDLRVSAVVISYNSGAKLARALEAVESQTLRIDEIIIVDNGSTDDSMAGVSATRARIVRTGANLGAATARNVGLREASSDLVLMLDADMVPQASCAATLLECLEEHDAQACVPRIVFEPGRDTIQMDGAEAHFLGLMTLTNANRPTTTTPPSTWIASTAPSGCYLLSRNAALAAGGFCDFLFFYFEDLEFGQRLSVLGQRIAFCGTAVAGHDRGAGTPGLSYRGAGTYPKRRAYLTLRNRLLVVASLFEARTLLVLAPALVAFELATVAACLARGWFGEWLRAWSWVLRHRGEWLAHRRWVQRRRTVPDRDVLHGGPIPLAAGLLGPAWQRAGVGLFSCVLGAYWALARKLI